MLCPGIHGTGWFNQYYQGSLPEEDPGQCDSLPQFGAPQPLAQQRFNAFGRALDGFHGSRVEAGLPNPDLIRKTAEITKGDILHDRCVIYNDGVMVRLLNAVVLCCLWVR
jgi:hypothetical protein